MSENEIQHIVTKATVGSKVYFEARGIQEGTVSVSVELPDGRIFFETLRLRDNSKNT